MEMECMRYLADLSGQERDATDAKAIAAPIVLHAVLPKNVIIGDVAAYVCIIAQRVSPGAQFHPIGRPVPVKVTDVISPDRICSITILNPIRQSIGIGVYLRLTGADEDLFTVVQTIAVGVGWDWINALALLIFGAIAIVVLVGVETAIIGAASTAIIHDLGLTARFELFNGFRHEAA